MRYGSGALCSALLFMLSSGGVQAVSDSGWSFYRDDGTVFMKHDEYGTIMIEQREYLDAYRFLHRMEETEKCQVVEKESFIRAENCRGFSVIEAVQSSRIFGEDDQTGVFYLGPKDKTSLDKLNFVVASLSGVREGSFAGFRDLLTGWTEEPAPWESIIREEQARMEKLGEDYDEINYWEYHVVRPGYCSYTFSHEKTGMRIIFENAGYLIAGDTVHNVSMRLGKRYGCGKAEPVPETFYKTDSAAANGKRNEIRNPYAGLYTMECLNNTRIYVADNGGGIFYDYVVKLPSQSEISLPEEKTLDAKGSLGGQAPDAAKDAPANDPALPAEGAGAEAAQKPSGEPQADKDAAGVKDNKDGDAKDNAEKQAVLHDLLIREFIRNTEILNPAF